MWDPYVILTLIFSLFRRHNQSRAHISFLGDRVPVTVRRAGGFPVAAVIVRARAEVRKPLGATLLSILSLSLCVCQLLGGARWSGAAGSE